MKLKKELYEVLACPICKTKLEYNKDKTKLICGKCKREYEIKKGIPILIP